MTQILHANLERLAEAEHGGWEEQKRIDGWTYSPIRNDAALLHDLLVPYDRLDDKVKQFDRDAILNYPGIAAIAGNRIVLAPHPPAAPIVPS